MSSNIDLIHQNVYNSSCKGDLVSLKSSLILLKSMNSSSELIHYNNNTTALHRICRYDYIDCLKELLCNVDRIEDIIYITDSDGNTPLHESAVYNSKQCTRILLDNNVNINIKNGDGNAPIHVAIFNQSIDVIKLLVLHGADIHLKNNDNISATDLAIKFGFKECISIFLDQDDLNIKNDKEIKYHLPQCREIIKEKRESFDAMINKYIEYDEYKQSIYKICFPISQNLLIPINGWSQSHSILRKYYHKEVLFLIQIHIAQVFDTCNDKRQQLAKNNNKTFLLMTLLGRYISDYV